ncbi:MAG TPA: phosphoribosylaminoimidazolesuccinocarboxamide synthase, partial [Cobetia sp.]|nr:phosphoribosylaminoimidazolesuccinocarboxamide synthase [Cobetia sp.]
PMINESLVETFGWAEPKHLARAKELTFQVNDILKQLFLDGGILLVDYKLE